jgi:hypothetical protein
MLGDDVRTVKRECYEFTQPLYGGANVLPMGLRLSTPGTSCRSAATQSIRRSRARSTASNGWFVPPHIGHVGGSQTIAALAEPSYAVLADQTDLLSDYTPYL